MERQDALLDDLSVSVGHLKTTALAINTELTDQEHLLSDLEMHTDTTTQRMRRATASVLEQLKTSRSAQVSCCLIIVIVVVIIALITTEV